MNGVVKLGLLLSIVGALTFTAATWNTTLGGVVLALSVLGLIGVGAGFHLLREEKYPAGPVAFGLGSLLLLPAGAVGVVGALRAWQHHRFGTSLGRREEEPRPRSRQWTIATAVFATAALSSLGWAVLNPRLVPQTEIAQPAIATAAGILGVLLGIEAVLLWTRNDEALRLGVVLSIVMFAVCAVIGFYLRNYFAIAMLALPLYGAFLVWTGRERWDGLDRGGPGIEGRGRRSRPVPG